MRAKLLNKYEEVTYEKLKRACEPNGAHVFPKVRVADTISLNGLDLSAHEFTYGLKSHFDFVVTDRDYFPLFSVEYDGSPSAQQMFQFFIPNDVSWSVEDV
jgi:hypothetical protein